MSKEKIIEIPESEIGMSGYSKFSWKLWEAGICNMSEAQRADQIMREQGYRKASDVINEFSEELIKRFNDLEYNANTPRKTVKVDELRAQVDWILHEVSVNTIKEFAEKYVEVIK